MIILDSVYQVTVCEDDALWKPRRAGRVWDAQRVVFRYRDVGETSVAVRAEGSEGLDFDGLAVGCDGALFLGVEGEDLGDWGAVLDRA